MREELVRRNYAATTIHSYLKAVEHFRTHIDAPLDEIGPDDLRSYHAYLLGTRKLSMYAMRAFSYWTLRLTVGAAICLGSKNDSSKLHDPPASGVGAYRFWRSRLLLLQDQFEFLDERLGKVRVLLHFGNEVWGRGEWCVDAREPVRERD
jgi:hypothetical protein